MSGEYARDPDYGKPPNWSKLYAKHCPRETDPWSRHARIIAEEILRDPKSPVRRMLIDAGYEPDHWAESIEVTIKNLWEARVHLEYREMPKRNGKYRGKWVPRSTPPSVTATPDPLAPQSGSPQSSDPRPSVRADALEQCLHEAIEGKA